MLYLPSELRGMGTGEHAPYQSEYEILSGIGPALTPTEGLEFGTEGGISTTILTNTCPGMHLTTVDLDPCLTARQNLASRNITFVRSSTADYVQSTQVDFLFIDANHTYADVLRELRTFSPQVKSLILCHDITSYPEVDRACKEFARETVGQWAYMPYYFGFGMGLFWKVA